MRVFQATYRDRKGEMRTAKNWTVEFTDHMGGVRRVTGFTDKRQTEALGRRIDDLVAMRGSSAVLPLDMTKWIESLPPRIQQALGQKTSRHRKNAIGLLDAGRVAAMRTLADHLDGPADAPGFRQHLAARGNTAGYVEKTCARVRKIFDGCGFKFWSDIDASKVAAYLHGQRADTTNKKGNAKRGLSAQTFNYYLGAFKSFCRWMVRDRRATESPIAHLDGLNVKTDRRLVRRALSAEECRWLLDVTRNHGPERYGMSGPARATLYRVALETGLRRGELASLTRASFNLSGDSPTVRVAAAYSKRRREDELPLRADTAADLRGFLAAKLPGAIAFAIPADRHNSAAMFNDDLDAARKAWEKEAKTPQEKQRRKGLSFLLSPDDAGRVVDFHAMRHTAGSLLAASGAHPKVAQSIMRHSTIELTMSRYTHVFAGQEADALAALPDLARPVAELAKMQATDNRPAVTDAVGGPRNGADAARRAMSRPQPSGWPGATVGRNAGQLARTVEADAGAVDAGHAERENGENCLAHCLAQPGEKLLINANICEHIEAGEAQGENPCKTRESRVESDLCIAGAGVAELADARDSKSRAP